MYMKKQKMENT